MFKCTSKEILDDPLMFQVVHNSLFSVNNMSDLELRESIIHDILLITMLEKKEKIVIDFDQQKLFRWVKPCQHLRIKQQMNHKEITDLVYQTNKQFRIKKDRKSLQTAMNYCGHWYENFTIPTNEKELLL